MEEVVVVEEEGGRDRLSGGIDHPIVSAEGFWGDCSSIGGPRA